MSGQSVKAVHNTPVSLAKAEDGDGRVKKADSSQAWWGAGRADPVSHVVTRKQTLMMDGWLQQVAPGEAPGSVGGHACPKQTELPLHNATSMNLLTGASTLDSPILTRLTMLSPYLPLLMLSQ